ncbi:uncharacterized protein PG986_004442 [Apiospora aurea]|uniref:NACHT domain-containing protein n=1 Tax=Apiospora aurea TaxID=335848 RepID=A0ABR1QMU7_9PEZI
MSFRPALLDNMKHAVAEELIQVLESLKPNRIQVQTKYTSQWSNFHAALKTVWNADRIRDLLNRLEVYQRQVNLRALAFISEKLGILATVSKDIEGEVFNIKEILALDQRKLVQAVKGESAQLQRRLEASDALHKQGRQDLIAAILTLQNSDVRVLPHGGSPVDPGVKPRMPQSVVRLHYRSGISFDDYQDFQQPVLDCLHFRHLADRYYTIPEAHKRTFNWIFCDPEEQGKPWDNFSAWLTGSQPCYWTNGKAASGKSTLMKHVQCHATTNSLLGQWAKAADLICPAFFFWHLGTELQRSQEGLLRSLLHDIFTQYPRLIISVMPELCHAFGGHPNLRLQDLTGEDIRHYIQDHLGPKLQSKGGPYLSLVDNLVEKASGVFLWVALVVKSMLEGLRNGDNLAELVERTKQLPPELKSLFSYMLHQTPPMYRKQSYQLLQMALASLEVESRHRGHPILAFQLALAEEDWNYAKYFKPASISRDAERRKCAQFEARITSRCCGLLEYHEGKPQRRFRSANRPMVRFIHKTAVEFLREDEQPQVTWSNDFDPCFRPYDRLFASAMMLGKNFPVEIIEAGIAHPGPGSGSLMWKSIETALAYAREAQEKQNPLPSHYLTEFDNVYSQLWTDVSQFKVNNTHVTPPPASWSIAALCDYYASHAETVLLFQGSLVLKDVRSTIFTPEFGAMDVQQRTRVSDTLLRLFILLATVGEKASTAIGVTYSRDGGALSPYGWNGAPLAITWNGATLLERIHEYPRRGDWQKDIMDVLDKIVSNEMPKRGIWPDDDANGHLAQPSSGPSTRAPSSTPPPSYELHLHVGSNKQKWNGSLSGTKWPLKAFRRSLIVFGIGAGKQNS